MVDYASRNPDWHDADAPHKARVIAAAMASGPAGSVLDVGCGAGGVIEGLANRLGGDWGPFAGWDVAAEAIRRARARGASDVVYVHGDAVAAGTSADWVVCADVFEHVVDDLDFLRRLRGCGRRFVFRIPLDLSVWDSLRPGRMLDARRRYGHLHAYNRELALELLEEAGFVVVSEHYDRVPVTLRGPSRVSDAARRALVRASPHRGVRWMGGFSLLVVAERGP